MALLKNAAIGAICLGLMFGLLVLNLKAEQARIAKYGNGDATLEFAALQ